MGRGDGRRCRVRGLVTGLFLVAAGGGSGVSVCRWGLGLVGAGGSLRVLRQSSRPGGGGDGVRKALLGAGGAGLDVGVACACPAVVAVRGWPRCSGRSSLPGHPGAAVVRKQGAAAGGWCSLAWIAVEGAAGGGWELVVGSGAVGACARPMLVYGGAWWPECCEPVQWGQ